MNTPEKRQFIRELVNNVRNEMLSNARKMPDNWNGIELRQYISDAFSDVVIRDIMPRKSRRFREYQNTVIINNL